MDKKSLDGASMEELVRIGVELGQINRYLYKYRPLKRLEDILLNGELRFSNPLSFNDPFDCRINVNTDNTVEEIEEYILKVNGENFGQEKAKGLARIMVSQPKEWNKLVQTNIDKHIQSSGICCFGGNYDSILMWSHYADSHQGVCLEFDVSLDPSFFVVPIPINYQKNYPSYNHIRDQQELVDRLLRTKAKDWEYEEEVRIVKSVIGPQKFKKEALSKIIFGCKCDPENIARIKNLTSDGEYPNVMFSKAVLKENEFGLDFVTVK